MNERENIYTWMKAGCILVLQEAPEQAVCNQCGDLSMSEGISLYVAMTDVSGYNDSKPKLYTV